MRNRFRKFAYRVPLLFTGCLAMIGAARTGEDCVERHGMMLREAVRASTMTDAPRENHLFENLSYLHGPRAQVLRVLWWGNEMKPALRKELLRQWINDCRPEPTPQQVKTRIMSTIGHFSPEAKSARTAELDDILENFKKNPEAMRQTKNGECWVEGDVPVEVLNAVDESVIFSGDAERWREMIGRLPGPHEAEGGDDVNGTVYLQMLTLCPPLNDPDAEERLIEGAFHGHYNSYYTIEERLNELPSTLRTERIQTLKRATTPTWALPKPKGGSVAPIRAE